jgi:ATP-dependent protease HslVU (ClpYQ) ATPase subunit
MKIEEDGIVFIDEIDKIASSNVRKYFFNQTRITRGLLARAQALRVSSVICCL